MQEAKLPVEEQDLVGLVEMTNEEYHSGPGVSKSMLDSIAPEQQGTALKFWDSYINPEREPQEYKHCFAVGDGTHKLVLEPGTFEKTYAVDFDKSAFPDALDTIADMKAELSKQNYTVSGTRRELAERLFNELEFPRSKLMWFLEQDHKSKMAGKLPIPAKDYKNMMGSLRAIHRDQLASALLSTPYVEQTFFLPKREIVLNHETGEVLSVEELSSSLRLLDPRTGDLLLKCRPDAISADGRVVLDLKTTDDVSVFGFGTTIARRRYHVQAAWYLDILFELYGNDAPRQFAFIAAQKERPHDVGVHFLTADQIELGRRLYQRDLSRILTCAKENYWPGATCGQLVRAELPYWEMRKLTEGVI